MARADRPSAATEETWHRFLVAHTVLTERLDADLREAVGLTLEWYDVLYQLTLAGGRCTMGQLADALLIGASRCTRRVDALTKAGLVERNRHEDDARVIDAVLTAAGRAAQRRAAAVHLRGIEQHFGRFVDQDAAAVMAGILGSAAASARGEAAAE
jgi:DNA-binding MarR family transcriptional regulator